VALEVPPSRVPQGGRSPQAALTVALVALVSIVGLAILGKAPAAPVPRSSPPAALAAPSETLVPSPAPSPEAAAVTPSPAPRCVPARIVALTGPIARHPRPLAPTGFETLTPWTGSDGALVADQKVGFWALGSGRLTRLDASGRTTASWTFADDPVFGAWGISAAREGGVWLWHGPTIAWFDGERMRDVIAAPGPASGSSMVADVAEAADGSLWAATYDWGATNTGGRVFHWDGRSWSDVCVRPTGLSDLAIDARGGVWVAPSDLTGLLWYFDGTRWSFPPGDPGWGQRPRWANAWASELVAAGDGSVWLAAGGIGHFNGKSWTSVPSEAVDLSGTVSLAVAPDGTVWAATGSVKLPSDTDGSHTGIHIVRFDGRAWTVYDSTDGLPAPEPNSATITAVAASRDAVVAATLDGFYRLSGDRWVRAGPRPADTAMSWPGKLLAVSAREAWAVTWDDGLWHVRNGTWTNVGVAGWKPPLRVFDLARAPDGTLAVATDQGAAVLRGGHWTVLERGEAHAVTFARDGAVWVAEQASGSTETTVASFRFDGRAWVRTVLPPLTTPGSPMVALGPDGEPWVGSGGYSGSLDRFDGARWVHVSPLGGLGELTNVAGLAVAPNGDLWAALFIEMDGDWSWAIARYDGSTWTVHRAWDGLAEPGHLGGFAIAPDGSLWVTTDRGLARFDGRHWSLRFPAYVPVYVFSALSFAPDGTLWAVGPSGVQRLRPARPELPVR
jgi:ligand-binding sensor domain-containing protein